jgi:hypothetical protein
MEADSFAFAPLTCLERHGAIGRQEVKQGDNNTMDTLCRDAPFRAAIGCIHSLCRTRCICLPNKASNTGK